MSDGLRLPEGTKFLGLHICAKGTGGFDVTLWADIPIGKHQYKEYRVNIARPTLKEGLLEAGKFLDEGLGLNIQLQVKMPI